MTDGISSSRLADRAIALQVWPVLQSQLADETAESVTCIRQQPVNLPAEDAAGRRLADNLRNVHVPADGRCKGWSGCSCW